MYWLVFLCLCRVRTEGLGRVGFTQVDLGLDLRWVLAGGEGRVVVEMGLSWSEREGFGCVSARSGGRDLEEEQRNVGFLVGDLEEG